MSGVFGYSREAVRVKVKKIEGSQPPEVRKFSVDPQITSFEVLQSILAKAFDLKGEFAICYRIFDQGGHEIYMPLLSDWDLDAAFLKASNMTVGTNTEPCLCLRVDLKPFEECSDDWELKQNLPIISQIRTATCHEAKPSPRLHGIFNQVGKTLNFMQRAFLGEENTAPLQPPRLPLSDAEFRSFLDPVGQIVYAKELRNVIYLGGIDPSLRKVVWKHLLNVYPEGMTGRERMDYIKKKAAEYVSLREIWKAAIAQGPVVGELAYTTGMVRKDVLRTDRHHPFYAGSDDNQNIASLFNILTTYALNHPKVSYCQGMSDLASPLLVTMNDEAHAYICFCALMHRLSTNFMIDGIAMTQKFTHLAEGLMYYDPEFYNYLKSHQADDLLFCYRWLLLEMKREFAFEDSLRMLEVLWSSLTPYPPQDDLKLYDLRFQPISVVTPPISPLVKTTRESAYTKVCALRRQSSSISLNNYNSKKVVAVKRQNHSLDETIGRGKMSETKTKHQSLDDNALSKQKARSNDTSPKVPEVLLRPRSVSPLEAKSDSYIICNGVNSTKRSALSSSMSNLLKNTKKGGHFKDLKDKIAVAKLFSSLEKLDNSIKEEDVKLVNNKGKLVKNLNEFLDLSSENKNNISDTLRDKTNILELEKPKILLTKSSFDEGGKINSNVDTFDECSPDDSQEYFPMTTSVTREVRLEMENLDRKVFGDRFVDRWSEESSITEPSKVQQKNKKVDNEDDIREKRKSDDIFLWENPLLHEDKTSTNPTPDEQADIDYDLPTMVNEISDTKTVTPIKIIQPSKTHSKKIPENINIIKPQTINEVTHLTNSCEEVTEGVRPPAGLLPPPYEFGGGNPFLMFLCITVLLQHRNHIINKAMDYNEMAMHFDKMVRKHDVTKVLNQARQMHARYLKQHTIAQQRQDC